ncbi:MAG: L-rhamnose mutarotase, partial [Ruthenibacterium sp.]
KTGPMISADAFDEFVGAYYRKLVAVLKEAGICNYTVFAAGEELFGYYECEKGAAYAQQQQAQSAVVDRWNAFMADVL